MGSGFMPKDLSQIAISSTRTAAQYAPQARKQALRAETTYPRYVLEELFATDPFCG